MVINLLTSSSKSPSKSLPQDLSASSSVKSSSCRRPGMALIMHPIRSSELNLFLENSMVYSNDYTKYNCNHSMQSNKLRGTIKQINKYLFQMFQRFLYRILIQLTPRLASYWGFFFLFQSSPFQPFLFQFAPFQVWLVFVHPLWLSVPFASFLLLPFYAAFPLF